MYTLWPLCGSQLFIRRRRQIPKTNSEDELSEDELPPTNCPKTNSSPKTSSEDKFPDEMFANEHSNAKKILQANESWNRRRRLEIRRDLKRKEKTCSLESEREAFETDEKT